MHGYKYCMQHHVVNIMYELFPFLQQFSSLFIHIKYYISKVHNSAILFIFWERMPIRVGLFKSLSKYVSWQAPSIIKTNVSKASK